MSAIYIIEIADNLLFLSFSLLKMQAIEGKKSYLW